MQYVRSNTGFVNLLSFQWCGKVCHVFPLLYCFLMDLKLGYNKQIHSELKAEPWQTGKIHLILK